MITLYRLDAPGAYRTVWLLEELQLAYQISSQAHQNHHLTQCPQIIPQICLQDESFHITGSCTIADFVLNKYDRRGLRPPIASTAYIDYQQWVHYIECALLPCIQQWLGAEKLANSRVPFFARSILKKVVNTAVTQPLSESLQQNLLHIEQTLSQSSWLCDNYFSVADIQLSYALELLSSKGFIQATEFPNIFAFLEAVQARPAYKIAQEKVASYQVLPVVEEEVEQAESEAESS